MKRNNVMSMFAMLLVAIFCLCACQKEQRTVKEVVDDNQKENYFDLEAIKQSGQNVDACFSFGVNNYDEDKSQILYDGGELQVDFEVSPQDCSFECSVLIYIDGILQKYALEPQGQISEQHTVSVDNKATIISTYFTPQVDANKKKHRIHFLCMYDPEYEPDENRISYGHAHNISQLMSWELVLKGEVSQSTETIMLGKGSTITKEKRKQYERESQNGTSANKLEEKTFWEVEKGDRDGEVIFRVLGGIEGKYRLSAYVGHKLVEFKNGAKYIDISLDSKHMYEGNIEVGTLTEKEYDTLYFLLLPINNFGTSMVEKSSSMCLYRGGLLDDTDQ